MTPEELNRTMDFITASQARLAAAQEHDRQDRVEFQIWSKGVTDRVVRLQETQSQLLVYQSERMDRLEVFYEDALREIRDFRTQALHLLHLILDKLQVVLDRLPPGPMQNPN